MPQVQNGPAPGDPGFWTIEKYIENFQTFFASEPLGSDFRIKVKMALNNPTDILLDNIPFTLGTKTAKIQKKQHPLWYLGFSFDCYAPKILSSWCFKLHALLIMT